MLVLPVFVLVLLLLLLVFLILLRFDTCALLHLAQAEGVGHERLVCSLLLLLDSEQRILADLGGGVTNSIRVLCRNEVLVRSPELETGVSVSDWRAYGE